MSFSMGLSSSKFGAGRPCQIPNCPLNEAGMRHDVGLYKHRGYDRTGNEGAVVFGDSNPPGFIWQAFKARREAMAKIHRGENVAENQNIVRNSADVEGRFLELHGPLSTS